jgi:hypothetical protein
MATQLYPQALASLFVASYNSQGYDPPSRGSQQLALIESRHSRPLSLHRIVEFVCCREKHLFAEPLPSNGYMRSLPSNGPTRHNI